MKKADIYRMLREITESLHRKEPGFPTLPERPEETALLNDLGLDIISLPDVVAELKTRLGGRDLGLDKLLNPADVNAMTLGNLLSHIQAMTSSQVRQPVVVYVDDEEENLFIFKRRFGKHLSLKTFSDPIEALDFIKTDDSVGLVITDEVMPRLSGNQLCDEVHKAKPTMKFILITGNPNGDGDLMYKSLRQNRFYEFINKPLDLEGKGEEYLTLIQGLVSFEW